LHIKQVIIRNLPFLCGQARKLLSLAIKII